MSFILSRLATQPVAYGVPDGKNSNAKVVAVPQINWNAPSDEYIIDVSQSNQMLDMQNIQGVFAYNTSFADVILTVLGTNYVARLIRQSQTILPLICSDRPVFQVINTTQNAGDGSTQLWFVNYPVVGYTSGIFG